MVVGHLRYQERIQAGWALGRAPTPEAEFQCTLFKIQNCRRNSIQNELINSIHAPVHHWAPTLEEILYPPLGIIANQALC